MAPNKRPSRVSDPAPPKKSQSSTRARVAIVVQTRLYRELLRQALAATVDHEILDLGDGGAESLDRLVEISPEAVVIDLPAARSLFFVRDLHQRCPSSRLLAINSSEDEDHVLRLFEAGLVGAVPRSGTMADVAAAVGNALRDEFQCPPKMAAALVRRLQRLGEGKRRTSSQSGLTRREEQVIRLVEQGLSNKGIAERLGIELSTVKNHVHNILAKLAATRRTDAVTLHREEPSPLRLLRRNSGSSRRRPS
jgi:two-component system nitrate/nitrite response regulator NarL